MPSAISVSIKDETRKVAKLAEKANRKNLGKAGAYVRGVAQRMIKVSPEPSAPGTPPHTRKGRLKKAILYGVERSAQEVVAGPTRSAIGLIGHAHEFGGTEPAKKPRSRKPRKWKLDIGGHGPLRTDGKSVVGVGRLRTAAQIRRAWDIVVSLPEAKGGMAAPKPRHYPPRPFMGKALEISRERLPAMWHNSLKGA